MSFRLRSYIFLPWLQVCSNAARVYVQEQIFDEFREKILKKVQSIRVGDPFDAQTQMGALISEDHLKKVLSYVDGAKKEVSSSIQYINRFHSTE